VVKSVLEGGSGGDPDVPGALPDWEGRRLARFGLGPAVGPSSRRRGRDSGSDAGLFGRWFGATGPPDGVRSAADDGRLVSPSPDDTGADDPGDPSPPHAPGWPPFDDPVVGKRRLALVDLAFLSFYAGGEEGRRRGRGGSRVDQVLTRAAPTPAGPSRPSTAPSPFLEPPGMFVSGRLGDAVDLRLLLTAGMTLSALLTAAFGLAEPLGIHSLYYFIAVSALAGLFQSTGWPAVVSVVGRWVGHGRRGLVMGAWNSHTSIGNMVGTVVSAMALSGGGDGGGNGENSGDVATGWGWAFGYPAMMMGGVGLLVFLLLVPEPADAGLAPVDADVVDDNDRGANGNDDDGSDTEGAWGRGRGRGHEHGHRHGHRHRRGHGHGSHADGSHWSPGRRHRHQHGAHRGPAVPTDATSTGGGIAATTLAATPWGDAGHAGLAAEAGPVAEAADAGPAAEADETPPSALATPLPAPLPHRHHSVGLIQAWGIPGVPQYAICLFFCKAGGTMVMPSLSLSLCFSLSLFSLAYTVAHPVSHSFYPQLIAYTFLYWLPYYIGTTPVGDRLLTPREAGDLSTLFDLGGILGGVTCGVLSDAGDAPALTAVTFIVLAVPALRAYQTVGSTSLFANIGTLMVAGALVNGPYALITTAVSADLGSRGDHDDPAGGEGERALATVTALIDGSGSVGAALGPFVTGYVSELPGGFDNVFRRGGSEGRGGLWRRARVARSFLVFVSSSYSDPAPTPHNLLHFLTTLPPGCSVWPRSGPPSVCRASPGPRSPGWGRAGRSGGCGRGPRRSTMPSLRSTESVGARVAIAGTGVGAELGVATGVGTGPTTAVRAKQAATLEATAGVGVAVRAAAAADRCQSIGSAAANAAAAATSAARVSATSSEVTCAGRASTTPAEATCGVRAWTRGGGLMLTPGG